MEDLQGKLDIASAARTRLQSQVEEQQHHIEQLTDKLAERKRAKADEDGSSSSTGSSAREERRRKAAEAQPEQAEAN